MRRRKEGVGNDFPLLHKKTAGDAFEAWPAVSAMTGGQSSVTIKHGYSQCFVFRDSGRRLKVLTTVPNNHSRSSKHQRGLLVRLTFLLCCVTDYRFDGSRAVFVMLQKMIEASLARHENCESSC